MANLFTWLFGHRDRDRDARFDVRHPPILPTPDTGPVRSSLPAEANADTLPPVQNWSHPFKDTRNPLLQLTHLAKAKAGYYPLGINGLWHGGVHFDNGTAGTLDQSSVHCLADGEVVAYRIDQHSPTTSYIANKLPVQRPFSRNFVLVRHRLQAPKIEGSADTPPSLTFFSLYLHLQDWADYQTDAAMARPAFWPEQNLRVKANVSDSRRGTSAPRGLTAFNKAADNAHDLDLLAPGAPVVVSGEGKYRKLENVRGPALLCNADGTLQGYIAFRYLDLVCGATYRVNCDRLNVRPVPHMSSEVLLELRYQTEVTISGEGEFRKLESIAQYVLFTSLQGERTPQTGNVVVPDRPVTIKAGDLIGHIGLYQDSHADRPEKKLHLEVFSGDDVDLFIEASRAWANRLPASSKTWLKLAKGTAVVAHQDNYSARQRPIPDVNSTPSDADLLVPKSLLDGLPAERKIAVPATSIGQKTYNWYRLDGLLHDADNNLLDGWVREEVGVTPWVSPWSWDGYDLVQHFDLPRQMLASFQRATGGFSEAQLERFSRMADEGDKGPIKQRLHDLIDRNRDGQITAKELQAALHLPAHAQSISQLIIRAESEWYYRTLKWDALDEILGHSGSTPHLNWLAEKERLKQLSWWDEVAEKVGLPGYGKVYHFHPVGLVGHFAAVSDDNDLKWLKVPYGQLTFDVEGNDIEDESHPLYRYFSRVVHWPGGASGITIGRGYDLGQRPDPGSDLRAAGVEQPLLSWLIGAKGLQGDKAKNYLAQAPVVIRKHKITRKQQYDLFLPVYEYMKREVIRISDIKLIRDNYGTLKWNAVDRQIQDIVIDLIYRGDYGKNTRTFIQKPFVENNLGEIKEAISNRTNWLSVPNDRFKRRSEYLEK
ncbi:pesticin C-terminus-like muramidase [Pseudomonas sp. LS1212]|uniref:pesticin C-terminus-like muramidase n=1 Tax=Pseudomonas sp. LS1212 TaxID=2972478 RepID=UPI00215BC6DB|nr:pesticin C-terminus-like muramidase [Pseudomonas sp. LS1212]UVJ45620.1 pesticin C-terminus-like muramidase [Pseudomonas sp. LS1212]